MLRHVRYTDRHRAFRLLYAMNDPWQMASARERYRFEETNRIIRERLGRSATLLEIGCGEGHQTAHLMEIADRVHGVDVSEIAIARARAALPGANFTVADLFRCPRPAGSDRYDLVVACEVLYYIQDIDAAIATLSGLGRRCLVSYFQGEMPTLDARLAKVPGIESHVITGDQACWKVAWWSPAATPRQW